MERTGCDTQPFLHSYPLLGMRIQSDLCSLRPVFQPDGPYASHIEIARIDTEHGEPHFDRLYGSSQRKDWLGHDYTYEDARRELFSNWREYADQFFENHS
jgi:hypothetical protein